MIRGQRLDVLIVGGGPGGAAAALVLAADGAQVAVLEHRSRHTWTIGESLPPPANGLLERLGLHSRMQSNGHLPSYGTISSWGSEYLAGRDFIHDPYGPGWQLDRQRFDAQLAGAAQRAGARFYFRSSLLEVINRDDGRWTVRTQIGGEQRALRPAWIVDATGRRSRVGRMLGARRLLIDNLVCVYSTAVQSDPHADPDVDTRTLVEAAREGWWYTANMPTGRRIVGWLTDGTLLRGREWRTRRCFEHMVSKTCHLSRLIERYDYRFDVRPACVSACSSRLDRWSGDGWLALGDAAFAVDPLSSQGLHNALASAIVGAEAILMSLNRDSFVHDYSASLLDAWLTYLQNRHQYYRLESRWPNEPFWRHRH